MENLIPANFCNNDDPIFLHCFKSEGWMKQVGCIAGGGGLDKENAVRESCSEFDLVVDFSGFLGLYMFNKPIIISNPTKVKAADVMKKK